MNFDRPTQQQLLAWASELRRMMKTDAFQYAVHCLHQDYQNRFFTSLPNEKEAREIAYRNNVALQDLISAMQTVVLVADSISTDRSDDD